MTGKYIPASKLLALQKYDIDVRDNSEGAHLVFNRTESGEWLDASDLRTLIDEAPEVEPVEYQINILGKRWTHCAAHLYDPANPNTRALYAAPQPGRIAELVKALENDAHAASFQSMAQYRKWLLDFAKGVMGCR